MWTDAARVKYLFAATFVLSCLALGLILWWVSSGTLSSREIGQEAREHRDHLLHSLTNGRCCTRSSSTTHPMLGHRT